MITTKPTDEIWADFEAVAGGVPECVPDGALFVSDIQAHYGCSRTTARNKMDGAVDSGWNVGYTIRNGSKFRYIYKD